MAGGPFLSVTEAISNSVLNDVDMTPPNPIGHHAFGGVPKALHWFS